MNLKFLGDALDHWKGSLFTLLQEQGILEGFVIDMMATDFSQWGEVDRRLYSDLLRIRTNQLIHHTEGLTADRGRYFGELLQATGDLFLDPDTGVCTNRHPGPEHLKASELHQVLDRSTERVVFVYQSIRARRTHERMLEIMNWLRQNGPDFRAYSYESPSVAMLILSSAPPT